MKTIPFPELVEHAKTVLAPRKLSNTAEAGDVAAAVLSASGKIYLGVCMDVACGIGFCAEHSAIAAMVTAGENKIEKIVAINRRGVLPPCGRCRELIAQICDENRDTQIMVADGEIVPLHALLPHDWRKPNHAR